QVEDHVDPIDQLRGHRLVHYAVDRVVESLVGLEVLDVLDGAGGEVVQQVDGVAAGEQGLGEMRPYEARAAGDQSLHRGVFRRSSTISAVRAAPRPSTSARPRALISRRRSGSKSSASTARRTSPSSTSVPRPRYSTVPWRANSRIR